MVHPSIIRFYGVFTSSDGDPFIVTELMPMGNLKDMLMTEPYAISTKDLISM
jgi:serine/threonine protein kinase